MAYSEYKRDNRFLLNNEGAYMEFICDEVGDVAHLPVGPEPGTAYSALAYSYPRPGSMALIADTGDIYTLTPSRTWTCVLAGEM